MPTAGQDCDLVLTDGSTVTALMCVKPPDQSKVYVIDEVGGAQADRLTIDEAKYSDFPPTLDLPFAQDDFSGGMGQREWDGHNPKMYFWGENLITHVAGKVYKSYAVTSVDVSSLASALRGFYSYTPASGTGYDFAWDNRYLIRREQGTTTWATVYDASASPGITDFIVHDGRGYIARGSAHYMTQGDVTAAATWTPDVANASDWSPSAYPSFWVSIRGVLKALVNNNLVYSSTDPNTISQNATWTGPTANDAVESTWAWKGGIAVGDFLLVYNQQVMASIDQDDYVEEAIGWAKDKSHRTNFNQVAQGNGRLYYNIGAEVFEYSPGTGENYPLGLRASDMPITRIDGLTHDGHSLYILAAAYDPIRAAAVELVLRATRPPFRQLWSFENIWETATVASRTFGPIHVSDNASNHWVLTWGDYHASGTDYMHQMTIRNEYDDSKVGRTDFTTTDSLLYTSVYRSQFREANKRCQYVGVKVSNLSAEETVAVAYSTDGGASFTSLGTLTSNGTSLYSFANGTTAYEVMMRFTLTSSDGAQTPILEVFNGHWTPQYRYRRVISTAIRCADHLTGLHGAELSQNAATTRTNLQNARKGANTSAITLADWFGNTINVQVIGPLKETSTLQERPYERESMIELTMVEVGAGT